MPAQSKIAAMPDIGSLKLFDGDTSSITSLYNVQEEARLTADNNWVMVERAEDYLSRSVEAPAIQPLEEDDLDHNQEAHTCTDVCMEIADMTMLFDPNSLRSAKSNAHCKVVETVLGFPSYPKTLDKGYATIVDIRGMQWPKLDLFKDIDEDGYTDQNIADRNSFMIDWITTQIQYSLNTKKGPWNNSATWVFHHAKLNHVENGVVRGSRATYKCAGVLACEHVHTALLQPHNTVSEEMFAMRGHLSDNTGNERKNKAVGFFQAAQDKWGNGRIPCKVQTPTCKLKWSFPSSPGSLRVYALCQLYHKGDGVNGDHSIDWEHAENVDLGFLRALCNNDRRIVPGKECSSILRTTAKKKVCDFNHTQPTKKLRLHRCQVQFTIFYPRQLSKYPWIMIVCHGTHQHGPPQPTKLPLQYASDLRDLIARCRNPNLSLTSFLRSSILEEWLQEHGADTLQQLSMAFLDRDYLYPIIKQNRLLYYPHGTGLLALRKYVEAQHLGPSKVYIQDIDDDEDGVRIFLFYEQQGEIFLQQEAFECDMSFKRIYDKHLNEVIFAVYSADKRRVFVLARVITSTTKSKGYRKLFKRCFEILSRVTGKPVHWHHIHGKGFRAVVADMDWKQASGLGLYLEEIDPYHQPWRNQLRNVFILCRVHFARGADLAARGDTALREVMQHLLTVTTLNGWNACIQALQDSGDEIVKEWAKHKDNDVIRCALNENFSYMGRHVFTRFRNHSNAVESAANKSYSFSGRRQRLLPAVQASQKQDMISLREWQVIDYHGMPTVGRSTSSATKTNTYIKRRQTQQAQRETEREEKIREAVMQELEAEGRISKTKKQRSNPDLSAERILNKASSSGYIRRRSNSPKKKGSRTVSPIKPASWLSCDEEAPGPDIELIDLSNPSQNHTWTPFQPASHYGWSCQTPQKDRGAAPNFTNTPLNTSPAYFQPSSYHGSIYETPQRSQRLQSLPPFRAIDTIDLTSPPQHSISTPFGLSPYQVSHQTPQASGGIWHPPTIDLTSPSPVIMTPASSQPWLEVDQPSSQQLHINIQAQQLVLENRQLREDALRAEFIAKELAAQLAAARDESV